MNRDSIAYFLISSLFEFYLYRVHILCALVRNESVVVVDVISTASMVEILNMILVSSKTSYDYDP